MRKDKLYDKFLFNFLASDAHNAEEIMEAGLGYVVPGIVSDQFHTIQAAVNKVNELKTVTHLVSVGLGGGGDRDNWKKVMQISAASEPGHLNQPYETARYTMDVLKEKCSEQQFVNALVKPTGKVGRIETPSGISMDVESLLERAVNQQIESIKLMPVKGEQHLEELIYLTEKAAEYGIRGVEPAGGIDSTNIKKIIDGVKDINIEFFMPHIFGSTIDKKTGRTIPEKVRDIIEKAGG